MLSNAFAHRCPPCDLALAIWVRKAYHRGPRRIAGLAFQPSHSHATCKSNKDTGRTITFPSLDLIFILSQPSCITRDPRGEKEQQCKSTNCSRKTTQTGYPLRRGQQAFAPGLWGNRRCADLVAMEKGRIKRLITAVFKYTKGEGKDRLFWVPTMCHTLCFPLQDCVYCAWDSPIKRS